MEPKPSLHLVIETPQPAHGLADDALSSTSTRMASSDPAKGLMNTSIATACSVPSSRVTDPQPYRSGDLEKGAQRLHNAEPLEFSQRIKRRPWKATFMRFGPLSGLAATLIATGSLLASLGILAGSDHQPVNHWTVAPPSTYLAIFTAISNQAIRYAAIQGVVIAWWRRASVNSSTVSRLHHDWRSGTTLVGALTAGRHTGFLGLACICASLTIIDGPLLQRASTVVSAPVSGTPLPLNITVEPTLQLDAGGAWGTGNMSGFASPWNAAFNKTIPTVYGEKRNNVWPLFDYAVESRLRKAWVESAMPNVVLGCSDRCNAQIRAPAAIATCDSFSLPVNYSEPGSIAELYGKSIPPPLDRQAFIAAISLGVNESETIEILTAYSETEDCAGELTVHMCSLRPGTGLYDVDVHGNMTRITRIPESQDVRSTGEYPVNHTIVPDWGLYPSSLAMIVAVLYQAWEGYYAMDNTDDFISGLAWGVLPFDLYGTGWEGLCYNWMDPMDDIIDNANRLLFISGMIAAQDKLLNSTSHGSGGEIGNQRVGTAVWGSHAGTESVFRTEYVYFIAAAIVEIVCIILILPMYWRFWSMGRPVSFSPVEMAKAFGSPIFANVNSNSSGRDIARAFGKEPLQYGVVDRSDERDQYSEASFASPLLIRSAVAREKFDV